MCHSCRFGHSRVKLARCKPVSYQLHLTRIAIHSKWSPEMDAFVAILVSTCLTRSQGERRQSQSNASTRRRFESLNDWSFFSFSFSAFSWFLQPSSSSSSWSSFSPMTSSSSFVVVVRHKTFADFSVGSTPIECSATLRQLRLIRIQKALKVGEPSSH